MVHDSFGEEDSNLHRLRQRQAACRLTDPRVEVPCGNRTRLSGLGGRCLDRSAKGTMNNEEFEISNLKCFMRERKGRDSNPHGCSPTRFRDGGRHPSAGPSEAPESPSTGGRNRTSSRRLNRAMPYRLATPVTIQPVRTVGFEPTLSGSRGRWIPGLSYVLIASCQAPSGI
jgi:hypothetical protein